ncbi:SDR family oxidoreductase [Gilvimarinus polysaccharolyticus]|uniref:SDR family oxidoreductase n=1 Tax=Gilvimarinus polysaccharolyticus TaxID=863921 RepID=UPI000AEC36F6|nr:SDR family oxidoreductase [Gilvimarinus polysaccharolyticus]
MHSEKLLIIGCGDLGRRLASQLTDSGIAITGVRRRPPATTDNLQYKAVDATDERAMSSLVAEDFDYIVLTLTPAERSEAGYHAGYVQPCESLVRALASAQVQPRKVLFVSSTAVYGEDHGEWIDEATIPRPTRYNGQQVLAAEQVLREANLPLSVLRLSGIYGPGRNRLIDSVRRGAAAPKPSWTNRIHADDAAGFMAYLLRKVAKPQSLYLVSDSEPAPYAEVVGYVTECLGVALPQTLAVDGMNKRIDNRRLCTSGYQLRYRDYREGFAELLGATDTIIA